MPKEAGVCCHFSSVGRSPLAGSGSDSRALEVGQCLWLCCVFVGSICRGAGQTLPAFKDNCLHGERDLLDGSCHSRVNAKDRNL